VKALVLIGGFGTRLRPITYEVPKQLIPIAGKPMLYHVLDLIPADVDEVILATGYLSEQIAAQIRRDPPARPVRLVPEETPLGTGGAMRHSLDHLSDPFFLLNSDAIVAVDLVDLARRHRQHGGVGTMALAQVEDPTPYGVAALGPDDRILRFVEKPRLADAPSRWINAGLAVWSRRVAERIPPGRPVSFEQEIVPGVLPEGVYGVRLERYWEDAGTPERLLHAQRLLFDDRRGGSGALPEGASGRGPVATLRGAIARGARFGPYVTVGEGATIEPEALVEDSVVMAGAVIGRGARVEHSLVGPGVRVEAGREVRGTVLGRRTGPPWARTRSGSATRPVR
jgi:mannose-1-phosphate guanylyltransferase